MRPAPSPLTHIIISMLIRFAIPDFNSVICLSNNLSNTFQHIIIIISAYLFLTFRIRHINLQLHWGDNLDSLGTLLNMALKVLLLGAIPGYQSGIRELHGNQQGIVEAVVVELGHGGKIGLVLLGIKKITQSLPQLLRDFLYL